MFGINKRMKAFSQSVHAKISDSVNSGMQRVKTHLRYDERVEKANAWASLHPRRFFGTVLGVSAVILASSLAMGLSTSDDPPATERNVKPPVREGAGIERVLGGMREIHANDDLIRTSVIRARMMGDRLRHEIDSLMALPVKTREDSMEISRKGKQLQGIISFFEQHEED